MKKPILAAICAVVLSGSAFGANYCPPSGCYPIANTAPVVTTPAAVVTPAPVVATPAPVVSTPTTQYIQEPYNVQVTRMVPVERQVDCPQGRWVYETRTVPTTRTVYENVAYQATECRYENRPVTRYRNVCRTVTEMRNKTVRRRVRETVCDDCGRARTVSRTVCETVQVPVNRRIRVQEPYTAYERVRVNVPVTRYRQVARSVPTTQQVTERRWVVENVRRTVTEMQPVVETQVRYRTRAVNVCNPCAQ